MCSLQRQVAFLDIELCTRSLTLPSDLTLKVTEVKVEGHRSKVAKFKVKGHRDQERSQRWCRRSQRSWSEEANHHTTRMKPTVLNYSHLSSTHQKKKKTPKNFNSKSKHLFSSHMIYKFCETVLFKTVTKNKTVPSSKLKHRDCFKSGKTGRLHHLKQGDRVKIVTVLSRCCF